mmetsp:Transcript_2458/g.5747  ORF Transcript_2458/g.5747 Transcript_2458/m.5747 type:complete len:91 (-) Transcript_2458:29-301(-)
MRYNAVLGAFRLTSQWQAALPQQPGHSLASSAIGACDSGWRWAAHILRTRRDGSLQVDASTFAVVKALLIFSERGGLQGATAVRFWLLVH